MNNGNVVCGSRDGQVKVWNVEKSECLLNFKAHDNWIYSTCCLADNTIATGSADYSIKLWNPKTGELVKTLIGHKFPVRGL
jgi:WD40 repeat protein